jgi:hypothetical protein
VNEALKLAFTMVGGGMAAIVLLMLVAKLTSRVNIEEKQGKKPVYNIQAEVKGKRTLIEADPENPNIPKTRYFVTFHKRDGIVHSGVIEATYIRDDVTIELIGDGCHIPRESMLLALRIKGADRIALITDAMRAAGTNDIHSILGARATGVPVVVKDDVAQLPDFSSYAGSIATMDRCLRTAHVKYGISLPEVSRMLSLTPARLCGCEAAKGSLEVGKDADIVVMTPDFQISSVYVMGKQFCQ